MNFLFIIPTAVNHFEEPSKTLNETLTSINSINQSVANNQIVVLDYALTPLTEEQKNQLTANVDLIAQHQKNEVVETVEKKYQNPNKTAYIAQVTALSWFLSIAYRQHLLNNIDYICILKPNFKITSELITKIENNKNAQGKVILPHPKFDINNKKQYFNDDLWLFSALHTKTVLDALIESAHATLDQLEEEKPFNLVSNFFKFIDANKIYYTSLNT